MKKKKDAFQDDGRVIAPMNVEGMPWYAVSRSPEPDSKIDTQHPEYKKDTRKYILTALLAALAIGAVFAIAALLFLLFAVNVWLK